MNNELTAKQLLEQILYRLKKLEDATIRLERAQNDTTRSNLNKYNLDGTNKQIEWANNILDSFIRASSRYESVDELFHHFPDLTEAKRVIENKDDLRKGFVPIPEPEEFQIIDTMDSRREKRKKTIDFD